MDGPFERLPSISRWDSITAAALLLLPPPRVNTELPLPSNFNDQAVMLKMRFGASDHVFRKTVSSAAATPQH